jgi:hypothetical protein
MRRRPGSSVVVDIVDRRGKCVATGVWPGGMTPAFLLLTTGAAVCEQTAGGAEVCSSATLPLSLGRPILVGSVAAPLTVAVILLRRSAAR